MICTMMEIRRLSLLEGARQAEGLTVIIDVFRAFTTACYMIAGGAERILTVGEIETAYRLKRENPSFLLAGERGGRKQEGFDFGNSPEQIADVDFSGRTVVLTTSAGTQGIVNATGAAQIVTGSFVNASAVSRYIRMIRPPVVSLVAMGYDARVPALEDELCAAGIEAMLEEKAFDFSGIRERLKEGSGARFFDRRNREWSPPEDFDRCLERDIFPFVLKIGTGREGVPVLEKVPARQLL